jgi:catechol 2,3-dioxygenase-like lactoylglutathione lyase family enzyme
MRAEVSIVLSREKVMAFVATTDAAAARAFYEGILGMRVIGDQPFALVLDAMGTKVRVQKVEKVARAPYTVLGWEVEDIVGTVRALTEKGIAFTRYPGMQQDELGIWTSPGGGRVAWFQDPDGNVLSLTG